MQKQGNEKNTLVSKRSRDLQFLRMCDVFNGLRKGPSVGFRK